VRGRVGHAWRRLVSALGFLARETIRGSAKRFLIEQRFIGRDAATFAHEGGNQLGRMTAALFIEELVGRFRLRHRDFRSGPDMDRARRRKLRALSAERVARVETAAPRFS